MQSSIMGAAVPYFVLILSLSAQLGLTSPLDEKSSSRQCKLCPPGEYQTSCGVCAPCRDNTYTALWNRETSCHYCSASADCIADFHLMVLQECNRTSNLRCVCEAGFSCVDDDKHTGNCRECQPAQEKIPKIKTTSPGEDSEITETTPSIEDSQVPETITSVPDETGITILQTRVSLSTEHASTSTKPCKPPQCTSKPEAEILAMAKNNTQHNTADNTSVQLAVIVCPVVALGFIGLFILYCVCHPGDEMCFKRAIVKLCNKRDHSTRKTHLGDNSSVKQQPFPFATNMGSIHVHNAETVVFSLLSHVTGKDEGTTESQKRGHEEHMKQEEEEEGGGRRGPVFHPAPCSNSPGVVHPSQEETDSVFFPLQEQGKDCHVSVEEVL